MRSATIEAILGALPTAAAIIDANGKILFSNNIWDHDFGRQITENADRSARCAYLSRFKVDLTEFLGTGLTHSTRDETAPDRTQSLTVRCEPDGQWIKLTRAPLKIPDGDVWLITHEDVSEQKEAEAFRAAVVENSTELMLVLGGDGEIRFATRSAQEILGYSPASLIGKGPPDLIHPDDQAIAQAALARGLQNPGSRTQVLSLRLRHATDGWRTFEIVGRSLLDPLSGGRILVSARDITGRLDAEAEASRLHALMRSVFDNCPISLLLCDPSDRILLANDDFRRNYPQLADCLVVGTPFEDLVRAAAVRGLTIAGSDIDGYVERRMQHHRLADRTPYFRELSDGRSVQAFETRLPSGEILAVGIDVTAIGESRRAAEASRASLHSILENIADMIVTIDQFGSIRSFNRAAERAFGYQEDEVLGKNVSLLMTSAEKERHDSYLARYRATGEARIIGESERQLRAVRKTGEVFDVTLAVSETRVDGEPIFIGSMRDIGERLRLTRALEESEVRFRVAFEEAPVGMSLALPDSKILRVNRAFCELLGYSEQELLGLTFKELTAPEDLPQQREELHLLRTGASDVVRMEKRYIRKDGELAWADLTISAIREPDGSPSYYISIVQDIRQRKAAEEAARQRETMLQLVADNVPLVIIYYDHELTYRFVNRTTAEWYRMSIDEIIGRPIADILPKATYRRLEPHILGALEGRHIRFTESVLYPDGRERLVEFSYTPHVEPDGRVVGAFVVANDIGERQEMIRALQRREREFRMIANEFPGLIAYADSDLRLRFINTTGASWYGRSSADAVGQRIADLIPPEHNSTFLDIADGILKGTTFKREVSVLYPDGVHRLIDLTHIPDFGDDGQVRGIFTFAFDLTERRNVEDQLRQIQKMEAIGQLTGGIAHDFNNLLGVIVGNLDLLARQLKAAPKAIQWIERAIAAAERGAALTQRLLAFSRRQSLRPRSVDVNRLLSESIVLLRRTLGEAVQIHTHLSADAWPCLIDSPQLEAALLNLCINARDAMPTGGTITIETSNAVLDDDYAARNSDVSAGNYVCISVSDTGTGMAPEVVERAFEPFFTTKPVGKGTGLGLSMVYGFVKQSGGHIRIYSEPGHGTAVKLYLPSPPERDKPDDAYPTAGESATPVGRGEFILVVEDNAQMLEFALNAIEALGYRALAAGTADSALELLRDNPQIKALFSDVIMPGGKSGYALAKAVRALRPELPVLLTSGFSERGMEANGHPDLQALEILQKPYRINDLGERLRRLLNLQQ